MDSCIVNGIGLPKKHSALVPITKGEQRCAPGHSWGPGVRQYYLIHYVISGRGVFYCGPNKFSLTAGQIFVIFPGTVIKYQADNDDPWHYTWITFHGEEAGEIFSHVGITPKTPVLSVPDGAEALDLIRSMPHERGADMRSNLAFSARLYEFMSLLVNIEDVREKSENAYLITAKRYIKAHYFEDITVEQVASYVGISRKYLFAIFKRSEGISPKEYIIEYRMKRAAELLRSGRFSVGNVAYSVGYKDPLTFSKAFKQKTGVSPSRYRSGK